MTFNQPRASSVDREVITYETEVGGRILLIGIDRETIEDYLRLDTSSTAERMAFVNSSMPMLTRCAADKLRLVRDAMGTMLSIDDLPYQPVRQ